MPVLLGIPALIRFVGWIVVTFFTQYFMKFLTMGLGRIVLAVSLFLALIIGLNGLIVAMLKDLAVVLPGDFYDAMSLMMPRNALPCIYAVLSLKTAVFIYDVKNKLIGYLDWKKT
ncbi:phage coat protein [Salmonella enterica subsp. enterica]|uniref:Phage coat protein n=3 Tax=Salmonella enterica TaxID=28901 RepID=A0A379QWK4_SALER|nr:minor coat protein [Salmonella enterica]EAA4185768.1 phage coat protein [Salmonella enterica subsp. enterica serovar Mikawasima]EAC0379931.1 phage coat protein [Salmonella enterica subsp. enterica serovar Potsdam]EBR8658108.1 phage coat protein [Salmonella enterica subsp. enterica serovar Kottbus]EBW5293031.1 phage coat protein [Salmonella enterica subsp. enterica serovar Newport]EBX6496288.1 phage coat protein [Salmonella enterica subsp. enterica serovar Abony]EBY1552511.1 phage coat prot